MSATPENSFIGGVHKYLPLDVYHMKNHNQYNGGIADVWYSGNVADLWVEYKFIALPMRGGTVIDLINPKGKKQESVISTLQQEWLLGRMREGRSVAVIVGCKEGGVWFPGDKWNQTYTSAEFHDWMISRKELAATIEAICNDP